MLGVPATFSLAQTPSIAPVFFWLLVLLGLVVIAAAAALWLRRWYRSDQSTAAIGFTLGDLRRLHREGQMTDDEFERAKARMIAGAKRALERDAAPDPETENVSGKTDVEFKPSADDERL